MSDLAADAGFSKHGISDRVISYGGYRRGLGFSELRKTELF